MAKIVLAEQEQEFSTGENFAELFESSWTKNKEGSVIKGKILSIESDLVIVDVGLKTEGQVPLKEFVNAEIRIGDVVDVYLERMEDNSGRAQISRKKALDEESWDLLEKKCTKGETVDGTICGKVKGGFIVDLHGVIGFLPGSQVDVRPVKDVTPLMNIAQPFVILKIDRKQGNIVVSRRAILEESRAEARDEFLAKVKEGDTLEGVVKNITDYGAFVDLGGVDGLLHVTDISWNRINHPSAVLSLGQSVKVKVIKYNDDTKRISLGMKQLESNPWDGLENRYPVGKRFSGRVTNITDYGAFVELEPGIEGLVHVSEISWTKNNVHPRKLLSTSQEVECVVLAIDGAKHRISLGMKQCEENPWQDFASKHPIGSRLSGEVKNIVDFGLFVGFENGIDGLVHMTDISWSETPEEALKRFKRDDKVDVKILGIDVEKERISLGIKQLESDPFESYADEVKKGDVITCSIFDVKEDGIEVSLADGITTFIKRADLARDRVEQRTERFAVGDRVDVKVISVDKAQRKISVSIKALEIEEQKKAIAEFGSTDSGASLGDILGAALEQSAKNAAGKDANADSDKD